jgi:selenocysteine-specific elongation factor
MSQSTHLIIGTAGHIDHGKTTLIRTLTGVDLDRLPEERARGITIALGFTHLQLASGRIASFVDVPGHERLVRTMIAGATGLDAVMLCVAATEGVMPQTREHLDILELLGVSKGFVVLTMCDLVDEEMLELAQLDVEDAVSGTFLEGAPVHCTAGGEQPQGMDAVRTTIDGLQPEARRSDGIFRMPIDRAFVQRGFGTVVTGTARAGRLNDGAEVTIHPLGLKARVRGLQVHGEAQKTAFAGQRTAVNLAGVERDDLARGMALVSDPQLRPASILDCSLRLLPGAPPLQSGSRVRLLLGTAEVMAVADLINRAILLPGEQGWVQLRTEQPISAFSSDRFILRRESPLQTLGGGRVLDPWALRARKKHGERIADELTALDSGDTSVLLSRAGLAGLDRTAAAERGIEGGVRLGERMVHPSALATLAKATVDQLQAWHAEYPLSPGAPRRALSTGALKALPERSWVDLFEQLHEAGKLVLAGPVVRLPGFEVTLSPAEQSQLTEIERALTEADLTGLKYAQVATEQADLLHLLLDQGRAIRVGEQVLRTPVLDQLRSRVEDYLREHDQMHPADFKSMTGLSRRHAIPLLEWLDTQKVTIRRGDARISATANSPS